MRKESLKKEDKEAEVSQRKFKVSNYLHFARTEIEQEEKSREEVREAQAVAVTEATLGQLSFQPR